jgi:hypothetical protein
MKPLFAAQFAVVPGAPMVLIALVGSMLLGGCSASRGRMVEQPTAPILSRESIATPIEKIPFRIGVSSATVEQLARRHACTGGQGAGLLTQPGPVEVYRMECDSGKVFMARCELRQCKQM